MIEQVKTERLWFHAFESILPCAFETSWSLPAAGYNSKKEEQGEPAKLIKWIVIHEKTAKVEGQ